MLEAGVEKVAWANILGIATDVFGRSSMVAAVIKVLSGIRTRTIALAFRILVKFSNGDRLSKTRMIGIRNDPTQMGMKILFHRDPRMSVSIASKACP